MRFTDVDPDELADDQPPEGHPEEEALLRWALHTILPSYRWPSVEPLIPYIIDLWFENKDTP